MKTLKLTAASAAKSASNSLRPVLARVRHLVPALAMVAALVLFSALGAHADPTPGVPTLPPTDTFNSSFADVQTWSTSLIAGPGKYVIYTMLSFIGFGLVVSWIKRSVKTH